MRAYETRYESHENLSLQVQQQKTLLMNLEAKARDRLPHTAFMAWAVGLWPGADGGPGAAAARQSHSQSGEGPCGTLLSILVCSGSGQKRSVSVPVNNDEAQQLKVALEALQGNVPRSELCKA